MEICIRCHPDFPHNYFGFALTFFALMHMFTLCAPHSYLGVSRRVTVRRAAQVRTCAIDMLPIAIHALSWNLLWLNHSQCLIPHPLPHKGR